MRVAREIVSSEDERAELAKLNASRLTRVRVSQRARIVLLAAEGLQNRQIAVQSGKRGAHELRTVKNKQRALRSAIEAAFVDVPVAGFEHTERSHGRIVIEPVQVIENRLHWTLEVIFPRGCGQNPQGQRPTQRRLAAQDHPHPVASARPMARGQLARAAQNGRMG